MTVTSNRPTSVEEFARAEVRTAHNYHPLPVVVAHAEGAWMTDVRRGVPAPLSSRPPPPATRPSTSATAIRGCSRSRTPSSTSSRSPAAPSCTTGSPPSTAALGDLCGKELVLPMNTGAEAVETAIKVGRKWGYRVKGVPADQAEIIVASGNFHGRTTTIVGFSDDPDARDGSARSRPGSSPCPTATSRPRAPPSPPTPWPCSSSRSRARAACDPARGLPARVRELRTERNVLFAADEIQAGLGRTGRTFACDHEDVVPDLYVLGKALGGGIVPVSAVVADRTRWACSSPASTAPPSAATRWPARSALLLSGATSSSAPPTCRRRRAPPRRACRTRRRRRPGAACGRRSTRPTGPAVPARCSWQRGVLAEAHPLAPTAWPRRLAISELT